MDPHENSDATSVVDILQMLRIYCFTTGMGALCFILYLAIRMIVMWKVAMYAEARSTLYFSLLVGTDVGVVAVILTLAYLTPRMVITWITTLVLEIILGRRLHHRIEAVKFGERIAREMSKMTFKIALKGGEIAAMVAGMATLVGFTLLRARLGDWTGISIFPR